MKRLYISQPMNGKTNEEILSKRKEAIQKASEAIGESVIVIDSFFEDAPHEENPLWYLSRSIRALSTADVAYFVAGWKSARGCRIEYLCALEYGIEVMEE